MFVASLNAQMFLLTPPASYVLLPEQQEESTTQDFLHVTQKVTLGK